MENAETKPYRRIRPEHNHKWGGVILIIIGVLFLLSKIPETAHWFPHWFLSWPVLLIGLGIFTGVKSRFRSPAWVILCLIGGYFLLYQNNWVSFNLRPYAVPVGIILLGILFIFKRNRRCTPRHHGKFKHWQHPGGNPANNVTEPIDASEDIVNVSSIFGSVERNVFSKDFKGATISSVFGGAQVNFAQADFQGTAVVDVSIVFGGADIIIPSNWNLKNEISVVFGGIEDRRTVASNVHESGKTLIIRGDIVFGGIEIKSY
jgi:predicted membrane protein